MIKTQKECHSEFVALVEYAISKMDEIDHATPYSENQPDWHYRMGELKSQLLKLKQKI